MAALAKKTPSLARRSPASQSKSVRTAPSKSTRAAPKTPATAKTPAIVKAKKPRAPAVSPSPQVDDVSDLLSFIPKPTLNHAADFKRVERHHGLVSSLLTPMTRLKSSSLMLNWILGGGILPGAMVTFAGQEAAGKSTFTLDFLGESLKLPMQLRVHNDAENAIDPSYSPAVMHLPSGISLTDLHREINGQPPAIRYHDDTGLEPMFLMMRDMLGTVPVKRWYEEAQTWAYVFKRKTGAADKIRSYGLRADKALSDEALFVCPTDYAGPEGLFLNDSYPAMLPEDMMIEGKDIPGRLALVAAAFSEYLKMVVGRLRSRGFIMLGVNQIRLKPGTAFGDPRYEPGGEALKFYSSVRCRSSALNSPYGDKKAFEREPSVQIEGGEDTYHYKRVDNTKNKNGTPWLSGWVRLWVSDGLGQARGIDPVFDTYAYLKETGRIAGAEGSKAKFKILWDGDWLDFTWLEFKKAILFPDQYNYKFREILMAEFDAPGYRSQRLKPVKPPKASSPNSDDAEGEEGDDDEEEAF